MQLQRRERIAFAAQNRPRTINQVQHMHTAVAMYRQGRRCCKAECVQKLPFMQTGAHNRSVFAGINFCHCVDKVSVNPFGITVPLDVGCTMFKVDGARFAVKVNTTPVPQLECENIGCSADFQHHGICTGTMHSAGRNQHMVMLLDGNLVDKFFCRERLAAVLGRLQGVDHFFRLCTGFNAQIDARGFAGSIQKIVALHPDALIGGWHRYQQKDINNDILISYGYGDGGGGPTRAMLETSTRMEKGIEGLPKVRQAFARTYFDELAERVKDNRRLPTWEGELYFEYHRGTYTSMARNKRSNRKIELHMMDLELLSLLAQAKVAYPEAEIDKLWHGILINQFHDILPGSSIHEVYEVTKKEYAEMEAEITALREERLDALTPAGEGVTVYNTTGFVRSDVVELGDCKAEALQDEAGNIYPVQKTADGAVAFLNNLPAKGSKTFAVVPAQVSAAPFEIATDGHKIDTPFYTVTFDEHGQMTGIFDKENRREVLKPGQAGNLFRVYEDKPIYYDNWDIDIFYTEKFWDVTDLQDFTWTENGPVRATLHIERNYSNSTLVQDIHFYAKQRRIEFVTTVDWHEHQSLLKVHFPVNVHTDEATFEIQYGNLTRKTHANTSWDRARFESCGQKWMDLSEGHYGVSMLNDCKYGHSVKDSVIGLTLIKSGIEPNPTTDQEVHHFTYAIYPHAEKWQAAGTVPQAFFLNQPALAVQGGKPGESFSLAGLDAPNVVLETIKRAEDGDGAIVRMYECENSLTNVTLDWNLPFHAAESCNCLEQPDGEPVEVKDGKITFTVKPYEIKTIRIR